jgi:hypothetical protein
MTSKNYESKNESKIPINAHGGSFEIHVNGHLDKSWSDWLGGLDMELLNNGEMILTGHIEDQAALMGLLNRLYSLNLTLIALRHTNQNKNSIKEVQK